MIKTAKIINRNKVISIAILLLVVFLFSTVGWTLAYFQTQKVVSGSFNIGTVGATWQQFGYNLTSDNVCNLSYDGQLIRGKADGTYITKHDSSEIGDLRIRANTGTQPQYVRIKPTAKVGKNLFKVGTLADYYGNTLYFSINGNTITGVNNSSSSSYMTSNIYHEYRTGESFTFSFNATASTRLYFALYDADKTNISSSVQLTGFVYNQYYGGGALWRNGFFDNATFTTTNTNVKYFRVGFAAYDTSIAYGTNIAFTDIQLERGVTRTEYEKYLEEPTPPTDYEGCTDITSYLTFRLVDFESMVTMVLGTSNFWPSGGDGWYYFKNPDLGNKLAGGSFTLVCNNIVLSGTLPTRYTRHSIYITFEYETMQAANSPLASVWGEGACTALGLNVTGVLPQAYTRVNYIKSSGTQYINTGFIPNNNTTIEEAYSDIANYGVWLFGARSGVSSADRVGVYLSSNSQIWAQYGSQGGTLNCTYSSGINTVKYDKNVFMLNNTIIQETNNVTFNSTYNLVLFSMNSANSIDNRKSICKVYSFKVWDNGILVRDMTPCYRTADSKAGMYDLVNGVFYADTNGGNFTYG